MKFTFVFFFSFLHLLLAYGESNSFQKCTQVLINLPNEYGRKLNAHRKCLDNNDKKIEFDQCLEAFTKAGLEASYCAGTTSGGSFLDCTNSIPKTNFASGANYQAYQRCIKGFKGTMTFAQCSESLSRGGYEASWCAGATLSGSFHLCIQSIPRSLQGSELYVHAYKRCLLGFKSTTSFAQCTEGFIKAGIEGSNCAVVTKGGDFRQCTRSIPKKIYGTELSLTAHLRCLKGFRQTTTFAQCKDRFTRANLSTYHCREATKSPTIDFIDGNLGEVNDVAQ